MASSNVIQARKDIRYLSTLMRGLMALDEELGESGELDKLIRDRQTKLADVERQILEGQKAVEAELSKIDDKKTEQEAMDRQLEANRAEANKAFAAMEQKGRDVVEKAMHKAADIVAAAKAKVDGMDQEMSERADRLASIQDAIDAKEKELTMAGKKLATMNAEIERIKSRF